MSFEKTHEFEKSSLNIDPIQRGKQFLFGGVNIGTFTPEAFSRADFLFYPKLHRAPVSLGC